MKTLRLPRPGTAAVLALVLVSSAAQADVLITNGGFESGFAGWAREDRLGSEGTFFLQSGTASPVNLIPVPAPPGGLNAAMTDAQGPGSHVLYQDFVVPTGLIDSGRLRFDLFVGNRATDFVTPNPATLEFSTPALNQQVRVDILRAGTDPFSVAPSDVLLTLFQTGPGNPLVSGYNTTDVDLTALLNANAGNTLRLRFAEVDNVNIFQLGVDNVGVNAVLVVPEPGSLALFGLTTASYFGWRRRRR